MVQSSRFVEKLQWVEIKKDNLKMKINPLCVVFKHPHLGFAPIVIILSLLTL